MAGTTVCTEETFNSVKKITWAWTSASGSADSTTTKYYTGEILRVVFDPGATAPTALYDVTVVDDDSVDVLDGAGSNLSATVTDQLVGFNRVSAVANCKLTLAVRNAGDAKTGTVVMYIR